MAETLNGNKGRSYEQVLVENVSRHSIERYHENRKVMDRSEAIRKSVAMTVSEWSERGSALGKSSTEKLERIARDSIDSYRSVDRRATHSQAREQAVRSVSGRHATMNGPSAERPVERMGLGKNAVDGFSTEAFSRRVIDSYAGRRNSGTDRETAIRHTVGSYAAAASQKHGIPLDRAARIAQASIDQYRSSDRTLSHEAARDQASRKVANHFDRGQRDMEQGRSLRQSRGNGLSL